MKNFRAAAGIVAALFVLLTGCASTSGAGLGGTGTTPSGTRAKILAEGEKFIDIPYKSPPNVPKNFDCSGFIKYVFAKAGMDMPSASGAYASIGSPVSIKVARPGDLLIFTSEPGGRQISHVAILYKKSAAGELRGSVLLHAISIPTKTATLKGNPDTTGVKITEMGKRGDGNWQKEYFLSRFHSVRRVLAE